MTDDVVHDPLKYSIRWARVVRWQASRLREVWDGRQTDDGVRPGFFDRLAAETHFLLTAGVQLSRSLDKLGGDLRMPPDMRDVVRLLRNVREHWDTWERDALSSGEFRERWPGVSPWTIQESEGRRKLILAGLLDLADLETTVAGLLDELLARHIPALGSHEQALPLAPDAAAGTGS